MPRPPKAASAATSEGEKNPLGLTDGELRFIKAVFDNMTQRPDANWDSVATAMGLKDAKCAKERFRQMSVRHGWRDQASASPRKGGATGPSGDAKVVKRGPRTPTKRAKSAVMVDHDETDEEIKVEKKDEDNMV